MLTPSATSIHSPCHRTWYPTPGTTASILSTQILGTMSVNPHLQGLQPGYIIRGLAGDDVGEPEYAPEYAGEGEVRVVGRITRIP